MTANLQLHCRLEWRKLGTNEQEECRIWTWKLAPGGGYLYIYIYATQPRNSQAACGVDQVWTTRTVHTAGGGQATSRGEQSTARAQRHVQRGASVSTRVRVAGERAQCARVPGPGFPRRSGPPRSAPNGLKENSDRRTKKTLSLSHLGGGLFTFDRHWGLGLTNWLKIVSCA